jgi:hypothetical protein
MRARYLDFTGPAVDEFYRDQDVLPLPHPTEHKIFNAKASDSNRPI